MYGSDLGRRLGKSGSKLICVSRFLQSDIADLLP